MDNTHLVEHLISGKALGDLAMVKAGEIKACKAG